jgi:hypothetical protein
MIFTGFPLIWQLFLPAVSGIEKERTQKRKEM